MTNIFKAPSRDEWSGFGKGSRNLSPNIYYSPLMNVLMQRARMNLIKNVARGTIKNIERDAIIRNSLN